LFLATEVVDSVSLTLQSVDDVQGGDGLALGMLGVGDGVADDVLTASLLVDVIGDVLDAASVSQRRMAGLVMPWMLLRRTLR